MPGPQGKPEGVLGNAFFFSIMLPDNSTTVAPGADTEFPQNGSTSSNYIF